VELIAHHYNQLQLRLSMSALKKLPPQSVWHHLVAPTLAEQVMETLLQQQERKYSMVLAQLAKERTHHTSG
jgi:hypothetical protein